MATLNVKNLPDPLYRKLQARARRQRRSVAQEVICLLSQAVEEADTQSILELRGLGKEPWKDVGASAHVATERVGLIRPGPRPRRAGHRRLHLLDRGASTLPAGRRARLLGSRERPADRSHRESRGSS